MKYHYIKGYQHVFYYIQHGIKKYGFRLTFRDTHKKQHEKSLRGFKTMYIAKTVEEKEYERLCHTNVNLQVTVKQVCDVYANHLSHKSSFIDLVPLSPSKIESTLFSNCIINYIGSIKVMALTPKKYIQKCIDKLYEGHYIFYETAKYINQEFQKALNYAVFEKIISYNPIKYVVIPKIRCYPQKTVMNASQVHRFNRQLNKETLANQAIFYTLEDTGIRDGELLALHWNDINFEHHTLHIHASRNSYSLGKPKSKQGCRYVPLSKRCQKVLLSYFKYCKQRYDVNRTSYVILNSVGHPLARNRISAKLKQILLKCRLYSIAGSFTPHSFRHMRVAYLLSCHVPLMQISRIIGHKNPFAGAKVYAPKIAKKLELKVLKKYGELLV